MIDQILYITRQVMKPGIWYCYTLLYMGLKKVVTNVHICGRQF